ncbi:MAG: hypothetical protein HOP29_02405 [Phycisphaerales bacterium]|nr:hypothetical protein [Phycisphaerales bacterium]
MSYRNTQAARRTLHELASQQGGYFTAKQAISAGYSKQHVDYHVNAGNFQRVGRGLYRLPEVPVAEHDDLIRLSLWSRGRDDEHQAVASHETALGVLELGELLPKKVHLTVPPTFRKKPPRAVVLHRATVAAGELEEREGFRITDAARTLLDVAAGDSVPQEQLEKALNDALQRGLVRRAALTRMADGKTIPARLAEALKRIG